MEYTGSFESIPLKPDRSGYPATILWIGLPANSVTTSKTLIPVADNPLAKSEKKACLPFALLSLFDIITLTALVFSAAS